MTKRLLPRLAAAGVAGALALGGLVLTAPAANAAVQRSGASTLEGSLQIDANGTGGGGRFYLQPGKLGAQAAMSTTASILTVTIPALDSTGPVAGKGTGLCLERAAETVMSVVRWATCSGVDAQQWTLKKVLHSQDKYNVNPIRLMSATNPTTAGLGTSGTVAQVHTMTSQTPEGVYTSHMTEVRVAASVDVTGPATGETVATDKPVISGSGEPGASITVKDKDGNILGTTTVDTEGAWSVTPSTPLPQGPNTVTVEQDANGTKSTDSVDFTVGKEAIAGVTATIDSVNVADKSAVISGAGQPGATIQITGPAGTIEVTVDGDGNWKATVPGLVEGANDIQVKQVIDGDTHGEKTVTVTLAVPGIADVTAVATDINNDAKTAIIGGTGQPGATITVTTPTGPVTTIVDADGKWSLTAPGLGEGENSLTVTQTVDGKDAGSTTVTVVIGILETPIADPYIAGGALLLAAGIGITTIAIRRRKTAAVAAA
jgi:hypothetical protein